MEEEQKDRQNFAEPTGQSAPAQSAPKSGIAADGSIYASTLIDGKRQAEILKNAKISAILFFVAGGLFLFSFVLYLISDVLDGDGTGVMPYVMLGLSVFFLFLGAIYASTYKNNVRNAERLMHEDVFYFYSDHMLVLTYRNGEEISRCKFYYGDFVKKRETASYLYLYPTFATVYIVEKNQLPPEYLSTVRSLLGMAPVNR